MQTEPEQPDFRKLWRELQDECQREGNGAAIQLLQRAFEERERKLREAATTFAQMMEGWGPEYFPARIVTDYESTASAFDIRWEGVQALG